MAVNLGAITLTNGVPVAVNVGYSITSLRFINNTNATVEVRCGPNFSFPVSPNGNALITGLPTTPNFSDWIVAIPTFPASPLGTTANLTAYTGDEAGVWSTQSGPPTPRLNPAMPLPSEGSLPFNVVDFQADPTGVLDSTLAFTTALKACKAAGAGQVFAPPGTYSIGPITVPIGVQLWGAGNGQTILMANAATGDLVTLAGAGSGIFRCTVTAPTTSFRTAGAMISFVNPGYDQRIEDVHIENGFNGIVLGNGTNIPNVCYLNHLFLRNCSNYMVWEQSAANIFMTDVLGFNDLVTNLYGFYWSGGNSVTCENCWFTNGCGVGWQIAPTGTNFIQIGFFTNCAGDTNTNYGWVFSAGTGTIEQMELVNCWGSSAQTFDGLFMDSTGTLTDITLIGFRGYLNHRHGINVQGGSHFDILNPKLAGNSQGVANTNHGINIAAGVSHFSIKGGRSAGFDTWTSQNAGINIAAGASDFFTIEGIEVTGNTSSIVNGATGAHTRISGCLGYNPVGQVTAPAFPATTVAAQNATGADVTAYIANGTAAITVIQIAGQAGTFVTTGLQIAASGWGTVRIPAGGQIKLTYASGAPAWTWFGD